MDRAWSFAVPDWEDRLRRGETPIPTLPLHPERAARAVRIFDDLRLPDVRGHPRLGDVGGEWFRDIVRTAFAAADPATGEPLVNEVLNLVPKKNSKSTNASALALTAMLLWDQPNAEMLILGPTQAIAETCFDQAAGMIEADRLLKAVFHVQPHLKTITRLKTGATLSVKTFDMNVVTGNIPALTIIDELHLLGAKAGAERVVAQITGGMVTNPSALLVYITTQSDVPPQGVFKAKLDYARGVRDGAITEGVRLLPVLYEFPASIQAAEDQPWRDPALWPMVLPNLGRSVRLNLLRDQYLARRQEGIEAEVIWASQHLNIQIGLGLHGDRWAGAEHWVACGQEGGLELEELIERSEVATIGVDWGGADDLASLVVIGRETTTKRWLVWSRSWARPSVFDRRKSIAGLLRGFEAAGELRVVASGDDQAAEAADVCRQVADSGLLPETAGIGLDVAGIALLQEALEERGLVQPQVIAVPQGWKLGRAINTIPLRLEARRVRHGAQRIMAWAVGNAKQELRGSNYVVTKQAAGAAKIDPVMALLNAGMLMLENPVAPRRTDLAAFIARPIMVSRGRRG